MRAALAAVAPHLDLLAALRPALGPAIHVLVEAAHTGAGRFALDDEDLLLAMARLGLRDPAASPTDLARRALRRVAAPKPGAAGEPAKLRRRAVPGDGMPRGAAKVVEAESELRRLVRKFRAQRAALEARVQHADDAVRRAHRLIAQARGGASAPNLVTLPARPHPWRPRVLPADPDLARKTDAVLRRLGKARHAARPPRGDNGGD